MDLKEIKEIIESEGGKFIIVENDKPAFVIMSFEDFKKRSVKKEGQVEEKKESFIPQEIVNEIPKELEDEPLKIEDIPF